MGVIAGAFALDARTSVTEVLRGLARDADVPLTDPSARGGLVAARGASVATQGELTAAFAGRFDNRDELQRELGGSPRTDAELLLALYADKRDACIGDLRGEFVCAVHDARRERLVVGRDPFGSRAIRFLERDGAIVFSTHVRTVARHAPTAPVLHEAAIGHFLALGHTPTPFTAFTSISRIPAGHILVADRSGANLVRYFRPRLEYDDDLPAETATQLLREHAVDAVDRVFRRLSAPALLLDGGRASTLLAWAAVEAGHRPIAIELVDGRQRATSAQRLAAALGLEVRSIDVSRASRDAVSAFASELDEPTNEPHALALWSAAESIGPEHADLVAPTGLGELLDYRPGYDGHGGALKPRVVPSRVARSLSRRWRRGFPGGEAVHRWASRPSHRFLLGFALCTEAEKHRLLPGLPGALDGARSSRELFRFWFHGSGSLTRSDRYRLADLVSRLPDRWLAATEPTRRRGVRIHHPFLAPEVVGLLGRIPPQLRQARNWGDDLRRPIVGRVPTPIDRIRPVAPNLDSLAREVLGATTASLVSRDGIGAALRLGGERGVRVRRALLMLELWRATVADAVAPSRTAAVAATGP